MHAVVGRAAPIVLHAAAARRTAQARRASRRAGAAAAAAAARPCNATMLRAWERPRRVPDPCATPAPSPTATGPPHRLQETDPRFRAALLAAQQAFAGAEGRAAARGWEDPEDDPEGAEGAAFSEYEQAGSLDVDLGGDEDELERVLLVGVTLKSGGGGGGSGGGGWADGAGYTIEESLGELGRLAETAGLKVWCICRTPYMMEWRPDGRGRGARSIGTAPNIASATRRRGHHCHLSPPAPPPACPPGRWSAQRTRPLRRPTTPPTSAAERYGGRGPVARPGPPRSAAGGARACAAPSAARLLKRRRLPRGGVGARIPLLPATRPGRGGGAHGGVPQRRHRHL
jgi:hypothetical protein